MSSTEDSKGSINDIEEKMNELGTFYYHIINLQAMILNPHGNFKIPYLKITPFPEGKCLYSTFFERDCFHTTHNISNDLLESIASYSTFIHTYRFSKKLKDKTLQMEIFIEKNTINIEKLIMQHKHYFPTYLTYSDMIKKMENYDVSAKFPYTPACDDKWSNEFYMKYNAHKNSYLGKLNRILCFEKSKIVDAKLKINILKKRLEEYNVIDIKKFCSTAKIILTNSKDEMIIRLICYFIDHNTFKN